MLQVPLVAPMRASTLRSHRRGREVDAVSDTHKALAPIKSVRVTGNWRVVFRFEDNEAVDVDLIDYH